MSRSEQGTLGGETRPLCAAGQRPQPRAPPRRAGAAGGANPRSPGSFTRRACASQQRHPRRCRGPQNVARSFPYFLRTPTQPPVQNKKAPSPRRGGKRRPHHLCAAQGQGRRSRARRGWRPARGARSPPASAETPGLSAGAGGTPPRVPGVPPPQFGADANTPFPLRGVRTGVGKRTGEGRVCSALQHRNHRRPGRRGGSVEARGPRALRQPSRGLRGLPALPFEKAGLGRACSLPGKVTSFRASGPPAPPRAARAAVPTPTPRAPAGTRTPARLCAPARRLAKLFLAPRSERPWSGSFPCGRGRGLDSGPRPGPAGRGPSPSAAGGEAALGALGR